MRGTTGIVVGVAFAALCIWLIVRVINRRGRLAKWSLAIVVASPVLYVASFRPVCWMTARPRLRDFPAQIHWTTRIFWPIGRDLGSDSTVVAAIRWWATFAVPDGYVVLAPQNPNGTTRFAIKKGGGLIR